MVHVFVAQFAPQAHLSPQHVVLIIVVLDKPADVLVVQVHPGLVVPVRDSEIVTHSHIQIEGTVLRDNDVEFDGGQSSAPPVHDISLLDADVVAVHPVHELFVGVELGKDLVLLATVVTLHLHLFYALLYQEVGLVLETGEDNLITTKVDDRIGKDVEHFGEDFLHEFVGLIQGDVQGTHEASAEGAGHSLVLRRKSPAGSVSGGIKLRHDSNSLLHRILHDVPGISGSVGLLRGVRSVLGDLRVGVEDQGEGVLVHDVPVQHVHLVVHHRVDGLLDQVEGKEMSGGIDHQSSISQRWLVDNSQGQSLKLAVFGSKSSAIDGLRECLQPPHKGHIGLGAHRGPVLVDVEFVPLLLSGEHALQFGILKANFNFILKANEGGIE